MAVAGAEIPRSRARGLYVVVSDGSDRGKTRMLKTEWTICVLAIGYWRVGRKQ